MPSPEPSHRAPWSFGQFVRYYQAAIVNTAFGYTLYAVLLFLGLNRFGAQILSHLCGMTFNYFTYSRHVFREHRGSKLRFFLSYALTGILNLGLLYGFSQVVRSAYVAGVFATIVTSLLMFVLLKRGVFIYAKADGKRL